MKNLVLVVALLLCSSYAFAQRGSSRKVNVTDDGIPKKEFYIRIKGTSKYFDIPGYPDRSSRDADVNIWGFETNKDRRVMFIPAGNDYYYIKFSHNGYYLTASNGGRRKGDRARIESPRRTDNQKFKLVYIGSGAYKFVSYYGLVLDCAGGEINRDGAALHMWEDNGSDAQRFQLVAVDNRRTYYPSK